MVVFLSSIFIIIIPARGNGSVPEYHLFATEIGGDKVVYDGRTGIFWYPHLLDMIRMTRAEQQVFIDNLNAIAYGKRTDWRFATLDETNSLKDTFAKMGHFFQWTGPPGPSTPRMVWPVYYVNQFFPPTDVLPIPLMGGMIIEVYNGRTADDWGLRRDPDNSTAVRFGEAADHFVAQSAFTPGEFATLTYNYDQHYVADDAIIMDSMRWFFGDLEVSAWVMSDANPEIFCGNVDFFTSELAYEGPADFHLLEHVTFMHFGEQWFKWDITRQMTWGFIDSYSCKGELGSLSVMVLYGSNLMATYYMPFTTEIFFSGN